jgi:hypothetical protein
MSDFKFALGDRLKDSISKFTGICTSRTEWLNGCKRYLIQPEKMKDGKPIEPQWVDEEQVVLVKSWPRSVLKPHGGPDRHEPKESHTA